MGKIEKPMLASALEDIKDVKYPCYCTPKLDGIRCCVVDGIAVTRSFKSFPNLYVRKMVSVLPEGFDGEIIVDGKKFNEISHLVMSHEGTPDFKYLVFDYLDEDEEEGYVSRMKKLAMAETPDWVRKLIPIEINNEDELLKYEAQCLKEGYEGVMLRSANSPYKFGRSSVKEFFLVKLKRFQQDEATVIELVEQLENTNPKSLDAFGRTERSNEKAGMIPKNTLGSIVVKDLKTNLTFSIGSGFDNSTRDEIWQNQKNYIGKIVTYKHQPSGSKDLPRFPIFIGFRSKLDMS